MSTSARRRVVITGLGVICPLGNDVPTFWNRALKGENGIELHEDLKAAGLTTAIVVSEKPSSRLSKVGSTCSPSCSPRL